ncbi:MAG: sugar ABC transporter ATP-binding protein [Anaeromicrobium sp.]|jgi:simple sugar transport system ATP-binding protein|uniref:sugar ABC transporter ATP-binding protein n=1 Tax=Anaeromicrobium sp. TaxID=1929132 RepID=UPI0025DE3AF7|nr:sugar ABC transporter ATP-binding protein [Anaeromicrobium sp.]MCT4593124.1 sugar ABC transporter ATP-binding protein [Anaeromicrobium sp.]
MKKLIEVKNLTKYFGKNKVLDNINLHIKRGEILGLAGANGSGKSTLMNILFGSEVILDSGGYVGEVYFEDRLVKLQSSFSAMELGMGMIHQEFTLIPGMTIHENIKLSRENTYKETNKILSEEFSLIHRKRDKEDSKEALKSLGIDVDVDLKVKDLSTSLKQFIEIAREIDRTNLKLLFLDEPTAVLNDTDGKLFLSVIRELSNKGVSIVFVSHRLHELKEICDRVMVLRDGKVICTYEKEEISVKDISFHMIGHEVVQVKGSEKKLGNDKILELERFSVHMPGEEIKEISLDVYEGEILGVTSLSGQGKLALAYGLMGMFNTEGNVRFKNKNLNPKNTKKNIENGLVVLSDERKTHGLLLDHSIMENITFTANQVNKSFSKEILGFKTSFLDKKKISVHTDKYINEFEIKCMSKDQNTKELSGGNQQKVCLARAISTKPDLLLISEPTRGIDIAAKEKILESLININTKDKNTIIIASSELDDLKRVCDRIVVLCEGKISSVLSPGASETEFGLALSGERLGEA